MADEPKRRYVIKPEFAGEPSGLVKRRNKRNKIAEEAWLLQENMRFSKDTSKTMTKKVAPRASRKAVRAIIPDVVEKDNKRRKAKVMKKSVAKAIERDTTAIEQAKAAIVSKPTGAAHKIDIPSELHPAIKECLNDGGNGWITVRSKQLQSSAGGMARFNPVGRHLEFFLRANAALLADERCWEVTAKARQQFWSTSNIVLAYCLAKHISGLSVLITADREKSVATLWEMLRHLRDTDPDLPRDKMIIDEDGEKRRQKDSGDEIMLPNRSRIVCDIAKNKLGKSGAYHVVILSEADFYEGEGVNLGIMWNDFLTTMPETGFSLLQIESTRDPSKGGWVQQMYEEAEKGHSDFCATFVPFFEAKALKYRFKTPDDKEQFRLSLTEYEKEVLKAGATLEQLSWARKEVSNSGGDRAKWALQNPAFIREMFGASVTCAFDTTKLDHVTKTGLTIPRNRFEIGLDRVTMSPLISDAGDMARLMVWKQPVGSDRYYIGIDPAGGIPSADDTNSETGIVVLNGSHPEVVARWSGYEQPLHQAQIVYALGRHYNNAMIVPETNNHGHAVIAHLAHVLQYPIDKIYHERSDSSEVDERRNRIGWNTTNPSKIKLVSNARFVLSEGTIIFNDVKLIEQMRSFIQSKEGVYEKARRTDKDDVLMAFMLALAEAMHHHDFGVKSLQASVKALKESAGLRLVRDDDPSFERKIPAMSRVRYGRRHPGVTL